MKHTGISLLLLVSVSTVFSQRASEVHSRGLLHQTVFNTGELGRTYNAGGTVLQGSPSMEWPPDSRMVLDRTEYPGQHNSFGSGLWMAGTRPAGRRYAFCGAVSDGSGNPVTVAGVYSNPVSIQRVENFPVLATGELNPAYDPNEAEEIIIAQWETPLGVTVTRTSRAWSFPGYDSFIIYEYQLHNTSPDTIADMHVVFASSFAPSMFGYQRNHGQWTEAQFRGQPPNGLGDQFARFDLKRYLTYNHDREGAPDTVYFDLWSTAGNRGGLNSPQAVGMMVLHYDYDHLSRRDQTRQVWISPSDSAGMWDEAGKAKQPFLLRYENGNLPPEAKTMTWLDPALQRKTGIFQGSQDSVRVSTQLTPRNPENWRYWKGRTKGSTTLSWWQPVVRALGFYPYLLPPGESLRFATAEVVGYGPGVAGDRIYSDLGGLVRTAVENGQYFAPVPSWYDTLQYPGVSTAATRAYIGSRYLQSHPLPWYVTPGVVSIRDVADRAIEMYTGRPLVKYDSLQYEPKDSPPTGRYNTVPIPIPAPVVRVENSVDLNNTITWGPQVEAFTGGDAQRRMYAGLRNYLVYRSLEALGPWTLIDSVGIADPRYFNDGQYVVQDLQSRLSESYFYAVVSVDSAGNRSGMTNRTVHETQKGPVGRLDKVYVAPNPLILTSGYQGSGEGYDINDRIGFFGLPRRATIRIFSYSGQLVQTIEHDADKYSTNWYQISTNNQLIASGVYFFVVEDRDDGTRAKGKFVVIH